MAGKGVVTRKGKLVLDGEVLRFERYTGDWMPRWGAQWSTPLVAVERADVLPASFSLTAWFNGGIRSRLRIRAGGQERLFSLSRPAELAAAIDAAARDGRGAQGSH